VETAPGLGIRTLTLYAFSSDNWKRPETEVKALFGLFARYLRGETAKLVEQGVRFEMIGRRDRLPQALVRLVEESERATSGGDRLHLRVAVDYSSRDAIVEAARRLQASGETDREAFERALGGAPDVDLLIRTSGEQRLSDFLLWECAYAELLFTPVAWPDFREEHLRAGVEELSHRDRRFGGLAA
jgi:undecaprenyl diphosphate synthase